MSLFKKLQLTCNNYIHEGFNSEERGRGNRLVTKNRKDIKIKTLFHQVSNTYKALYLVGAGETVGALPMSGRSLLSSDR